jgi:hypothetical protein
MLPQLILATRTRTSPAFQRLCLPCLSRLAHHSTVTMSSATEQQKTGKFGHLPLSTSGPQKTSLTACLWKIHQEYDGLTDDRATRSYELHISTRAQPSPKKSATPSSFMVSFRRTSSLLPSKSSAHTPSTTRDQMIWRRTPS